MAINKYYDSDCNLGILDGKTVAIIGFGSQGHAHSENLAESGVNVVVGLREGSGHWEKAAAFEKDHKNFKVMSVEDAAKAGDIIMMLAPDELQGEIYAAMLRTSETDFRSNFSLGGKAARITPDADVTGLIERVQAVLPLNFAGVDLLRHPAGGYVIGEIEDAVGCRMLYQCGGFDPARDYMHSILKNKPER